MNEFFFGVYPYVCLAILPLGLLFRYLATPEEWNARSSNLFAQKSLRTGSYLFHYAIIFTFFGHCFGLLIPQWLLGAFGFSLSVHEIVAAIFGCILAPCVFFGLAILLWRRLANREVWASTTPMDIVVLLLIMWQSLTGGWQDYGGHYPHVFTTVAPWIRGLLCLQPDPALMEDVPRYLKVHVVVGMTIFALIPFSRLVHFFSAPVTWFAHPLISYRKRYENL